MNFIRRKVPFFFHCRMFIKHRTGLLKNYFFLFFFSIYLIVHSIFFCLYIEKKLTLIRIQTNMDAFLLFFIILSIHIYYICIHSVITFIINTTILNALRLTRGHLIFEISNVLFYLRRAYNIR